eukprot:10366843-Alexandrium_andersonii.AAC.1
MRARALLTRRGRVMMQVTHTRKVGDGAPSGAGVGRVILTGAGMTSGRGAASGGATTGGRGAVGIGTAVTTGGRSAT